MGLAQLDFNLFFHLRMYWFNYFLAMMNYIMIQDTRYQEKTKFPHQNMPAFVPVFELTVFFAAHLIVLLFYMKVNWPLSSRKSDVRTTDDHFLMEVAVNVMKNN
jgi:hypothetical protein